MFRLFLTTAKLSSFRPATSFFFRTTPSHGLLGAPAFPSPRLPPSCCSLSSPPARSLASRSLSEAGGSLDQGPGIHPQKTADCASGHQHDDVKASPPVDHRSRTPPADGSIKRFSPWFYAATAAAMLSFAVLVEPKDNSSLGALRDVDLSSAVSELQVVYKDAWARATAAYDRFYNSLSAFRDKASEAAKAMAVLARCVNAVLFTKGEDYANELALRWKLRVISLLADLTASSRSRRTALIQAGNGSVVDWLLEAVGHGEEDYRLVQAEAARALSQFLSDDVTCEVVLGRPHALSHLLLFAASIQPKIGSENSKVRKFDLFPGNDEKTRGRSMLVGALMDIITSSCESEKKGAIRPKLSGLANVTDISAALKVLREGSLCLGEANEESGGKNGGDEHDVSAGQEIGLNSSEKASVLGEHNESAYVPFVQVSPVSQRKLLSSLKDQQVNLITDSKALGLIGAANGTEPDREPFSHGLWDDLHGNHVAVPLAAWALATWATASSANCGKIAKFDKDGGAILACVMANERTVKWHGAIAARTVLEEGFGEQAAASWSGVLLEAAKHASAVNDTQLCLITLDSFYSCIRMSREAQELAAKNSLEMLRSIANQAAVSETAQKLTAQILDLLYLCDSGLTSGDGKKWSGTLLGWLFNCKLDDLTHATASKILSHVLDELGPSGIILSQVWLAMIIQETVEIYGADSANGDTQVSKTDKSKSLTQGRLSRAALHAAHELAKAVLLSIGEAQGSDNEKGTFDFDESQWGDLNRIHLLNAVGKVSKKDRGKLTSAGPAELAMKAVKSLTEVLVDEKGCQQRAIEMGSLQLLRRFILKNDYAKISGTPKLPGLDEVKGHQASVANDIASKKPYAAHLKKHAARMLSILSLQPSATDVIGKDEALSMWLEECANNGVSCCNDLKACSYARATLLNLKASKESQRRNILCLQRKGFEVEQPINRYEDRVFIVNTGSRLWGDSNEQREEVNGDGSASEENLVVQEESMNSDFQIDVVFVHGFRGGPFKTWRIADDKTSSTTNAGLVEKIDVDSGREGTCWPKEWLAHDIPSCRMLTVKYKTNLSQWSGTTLPLQEVSAMLLRKLHAAGVGDRPVVFITHSMGGLVVKQMLMQAEQDKMMSQIMKNTAGIVFYSCPHFGSKLADMPWRLGLVLRPAPSIGELRSGSARLEELNRFIWTLHKAGLYILSFSETKVTPLVEGYGGWALRMEVVPIESAYPGFGELVVLDGTDHVNSCKPLSRDDIAYTQTLELLQKISRSVKAFRA